MDTSLCDKVHELTSQFQKDLGENTLDSDVRKQGMVVNFIIEFYVE